jgi:hypothetical protein
MAEVPIKPIAEGQTRGGTTFQSVRASAEDFGAAEGRALSGLGKTLQAEGERQFAEAKQLQDRQEALSRLKRGDKLSSDLFNITTKAATERDLSDPAVVSAIGQELKARVDQDNVEALAEGLSEKGIFLQQMKAQSSLDAARDTIAIQSGQAVTALTETAKSKAINNLSAAATQEPSTSKILGLMDSGVAASLNDLAGILGKGAEVDFVLKAQAAIAQSGINELLSVGTPEAMEQVFDLLENDKIKETMSPAARTKMLNRRSTIGSPPVVLSNEDIVRTFGVTIEQAKLVNIQRDKDGTHSLVFKLAGPDQREKLSTQLQAQGYEKDLADNVASGITKIVAIPQTGETLLIDQINQSTVIIPKTTQARPAPGPERETKEPGLYQEVRDNPLPVIGIGGGLAQFFVGVIGQVTPVPEALKKIVEVRQGILNANNVLIKAFSLNKRFPTELSKIILTKTGIELKLLNSDTALLISMKRMAKDLKGFIEDEQAIVDEGVAGLDRRESALQAIADMERLLKVLGVPEDAAPGTLENPPLQVFTVEQRNALAVGASYVDGCGIPRTRSKTDAKKGIRYKCLK